MNLKVLFSNFLYLVLNLHFINSLSDRNVSNLTVEDQNKEWTNLCKHIVQMIMNSDVAVKERIDVAIFLMRRKFYDLDHDGFELLLNKYGNDKIALRIFTTYSISSLVKVDFVVILLDKSFDAYQHMIEKNFRTIFEDQRTNIFVVIREYRLLETTWISLIKTRYYNTYFFLINKIGEFKMYRSVIIGTGSKAVLDIKESNVTKYQTIGEILKKNQISTYNIIFYNSFPISYMKNGKIVGPAGNVVRELSKKVEASYILVNNPYSIASMTDIYRIMVNIGDICLFSDVYFSSDKFATTWTNEIDGFCLLIPRNIPVSSYDYYELPLDKTSLIMALVSIILVTLCWKIISIYTYSQRSISMILFAMYELTLNLGASGLEELTAYENFLIYPYIFASFILVSFYESIFLNLMLTETTSRAAESLEELISLESKFHMYPGGELLQDNLFPFIPDHLIINKVNLIDSLYFEIPKNLNLDLVYLVHCQSANNFLESSRNFFKNRKLFEKLVLRESYKRYTVRKGFFFFDEFLKLVESLQESGIFNFWHKNTYEESLEDKKSYDNDEEKLLDVITFSGITIPLFVLLIGCLISLAIFLNELIRYLWMKKSEIISIKMTNIKDQCLKMRKNINLKKWIRKYAFKKIFKVIKIKNTKFCLQSRESVNEAYFVIKRFKKTAQFKIKRKNKVQPTCSRT